MSEELRLFLEQMDFFLRDETKVKRLNIAKAAVPNELYKIAGINDTYFTYLGIQFKIVPNIINPDAKKLVNNLKEKE